MRIIKIFFFFICLLFLNSCFNVNKQSITGYLLLKYYYPGYKYYYLVLDIKNNKNFGLKSSKASDYSFPGEKLVKFINNDLISCINYNFKKVKDFYFIESSELIFYSLKDKVIIENFFIKDIQIDDYQILDDSNILICDHKKILNWNFRISKTEEIYLAEKYIKSFHYFKSYNTLIIDEIIGLGHGISNTYYRLFKVDLDKDGKEIFDYGGGASYSDKLERIIYNGETENKIKYYDFKTNTFCVTDVKAYWKNPISCFITEDIMVLQQKNDSFINRFKENIFNEGDHVDYILYNNKTKRKETILEGFIWDGKDVELQYVDYNLSDLLKDRDLFTTD